MTERREPGGSYRSRPFTAAAQEVANMTLRDIQKISLDESVALAITKAQARKAFTGNVECYRAMGDRSDGRPTVSGRIDLEHRETISSTNVNLEVSAKIEPGTVENNRALLAKIKEIYGLNDPDAVGPGFVPAAPYAPKQLVGAKNGADGADGPGTS
jgi:hypothetical protein